MRLKLIFQSGRGALFRRLGVGSDRSQVLGLGRMGVFVVRIFAGVCAPLCRVCGFRVGFWAWGELWVSGSHR